MPHVQPAVFGEIVRCLGSLYEKADKARFALYESGLDPNRIDLTGEPLIYWTRIVEEAIKSDLLEALLDVARKDYPAKATLLEDLVARSKQSDEPSPDAEDDAIPPNTPTFGETLETGGMDDTCQTDRGGRRICSPEFTSKRTIGGFTLKTILGRGGMGIVYRAQGPKVSREVALKQMFLSDDRSRARLETEIKALYRVEHTNLIRIYTSGFDDDQPYFTMELVDGTNFRSLFKVLHEKEITELSDDVWRTQVGLASDETRNFERAVASPSNQSDPLGSIDYLAFAPKGIRGSASYVERIVRIVIQTAKATQALHDNNIVHRDIKPDNIMLARQDQRAILMDLGVAKLTGENGNLTRTSDRVGTLRYVSPEQLFRASQIDHRSDIYSLGVTLWELLALHSIYGLSKELSDDKVSSKIRFEEPEPVRKYNRAVSVDLQAVIQKCLEKNPDHRYQSAAELIEELENALQGNPVKAKPIGPVTRWFRGIRRRPLVPCLSAALVLALALLIYGWIVPITSERDPNALYIGVKPWVGYGPLAVARDQDLCAPYKLILVPIKDFDEAKGRLGKDLDLIMCPVENFVLLRSEGRKCRVILMADETQEADAIIVKEGINTLKGLEPGSLVFLQLEAPHFVLHYYLEEHNMTWRELDPHPVVKMQDALEKFYNDEKIKAAAVYGYNLSKVPGSTILFHSGSERKDKNVPHPIVVDVLVTEEAMLTEANRPKFEALFKGWCQAVAQLNHDESAAVESVRKFLGGLESRSISLKEYGNRSRRMSLSGRAENSAFFELRAGSSDFRRRVEVGSEMLRKFGHLNEPVDPEAGDGSNFFRTWAKASK